MRTLTSHAVLDAASFLGILLGVAMLLTCYFVPEYRILAVPSLVILFSGLVYGMR